MFLSGKVFGKCFLTFLEFLVLLLVLVSHNCCEHEPIETLYCVMSLRHLLSVDNRQ